MNNTEKLTTQGTQDEEKQNKNVNKTRALLQSTGGKDEPNIACMISDHWHNVNIVG